MEDDQDGTRRVIPSKSGALVVLAWPSNVLT